MLEHQTEQELHSYLLENFKQIFNCQLIGHEVKLREGIVDFVGAGDTLYLIEVKRDKIQSYTIEHSDNAQSPRLVQALDKWRDNKERGWRRKFARLYWRKGGSP